MPRGLKLTFFFMIQTLAMMGCASTFSATEVSALKVVEADKSRPRLGLNPGGSFAVTAQAPSSVAEGESIQLRVQTTQPAFLLACERDARRPLYPSLAFTGDWTDKAEREWDVRLPWVLTRQDTIEIHVFAFREFEDFDALRYGLAHEQMSCLTFALDHGLIFESGSVVKTVVQVRVQR